jgi:mannose-6-phosphate isomerase-like protein (cupin superfamily)
MIESKFLAGKVIKRSLPSVEPQNSANSPTLKRLLLPQGELAQFYDGEEPMRYLAYIELRCGSVRGNHYHNVKEEWIYMISGEVVLVVEDIQSKARENVALTVGDLAVVQTGVAHAIQVLQSGQAIEFSKARFDAKDIHRYLMDARPGQK